MQRSNETMTEGTLMTRKSALHEEYAMYPGRGLHKRQAFFLPRKFVRPFLDVFHQPLKSTGIDREVRLAGFSSGSHTFFIC